MWERREDFLALNPDATTPVLIEEGRPAVPGATIIAEYLDETRGAEAGERRLLPADPPTRVEVRRLAHWFHDKFFDEVSGFLVTERIYKQTMRTEQGGGPPDTSAIRAARHNIRYHLAYIGWLARQRTWLAGERLSYADLAAAAHLSVADYLGDVPWNEDEAAKTWYARVKSRPVVPPAAGRDGAGHSAVGELRGPRLLDDATSRRRCARSRAQHGFDAVGVTRPDAIPQAKPYFERFIAEGQHGDMDWLAATRRAAHRSAGAVAGGALGRHARAELRAGPRSAGDPAASARAARSRSTRRATTITT